MKRYNPKEIEEKWAKIWKEKKLFSPDLAKAKKPYYNLMMFPYPSAQGLHVGNMYAFTGSDVWGRYMRMKGFDVFEPIGLDAFGIHSENYALKINTNPMELAKITEKHFYEQLTMIGNAYDWTRTVETNKPEYYKWSQWLFLQMYKAGLVYRKKAEVNWCLSCQTVLSDEQVIAGECERCSTKVEKRQLEQWFFKITKYADRLLANLNQIDWSEKVKTTQKNWIGKSMGTLIKFRVSGKKDLDVFTTRPDTVFGATFLVLSPEYPDIGDLTAPGQKESVLRYVEEARKKSEQQRKESKDKSGVFSGTYAVNPLTNEEIPIWVADYVLAGYASGAIMAVPGHDQRDFAFAQKYNLPTIEVIKPDGILINSGQFNGLTSEEAKQKITNYLEEHQLGQKKTHYHLRDWLISRQRYWGPPIPIIYCDKCGIVPVPEKDLPVELPYLENFRPTGVAPLASDPDFVQTTCPGCGGPAKRETDVSDTFLDSAWYYLRYPSVDRENRAFDPERTQKWLPAEMYIGGAEHAVLHLMYARFVSMVLHDLGYLDFEEPFVRFRAHGLIISEGAKMSKSKGNVINPDPLIKEYGADSLRTYLMFMGPLSEGGDFRHLSLGGVYRFLNRVWDLALGFPQKQQTTAELRVLHKTINKITKGMENLHYNVSIAALMEFLNFLSKQGTVGEETLKDFLIMLSPFAPFISEELWHLLGERDYISEQAWPKIEEKWLEEEEVTIAVSVDGKVREQIMIRKDMVKDKNIVEEKARKSPKIQKFIHGQEVSRIIYVPGRILNFVSKIPSLD